MRPRYFIQPDVGDFPWAEVSEEEWVQAERSAGFHNTLGRPDRPATAGFSGSGIRGRVTYDGGKPLSYSSETGDYVEDEVAPSELERLRQFARWIVSLDDPDPKSQGFQDRKTVTMNTIVQQAREALGED